MKKDKKAEEVIWLQKKVREQAVQLKQVKDAAREAVWQTSCALDAILAEVAVQFGKTEMDGKQKSWKMELPIPKADRYQVEVEKDKTGNCYCISVTERPPKKELQAEQ